MVNWRAACGQMERRGLIREMVDRRAVIWRCQPVFAGVAFLLNVAGTENRMPLVSYIRVNK